MKINNVTLVPDSGKHVITPIELSFKDPKRENPYNVKTILGLDAEELVPMFIGFGSGNRATADYNHMTLKERTVVIRIEISPPYSELRDNLYRIISRSNTGKLEIQFKNNQAIAGVLTGFITKFEASHFSKTPEVQITVRCIDPLIRSPNVTSYDLGGLTPQSAVIVDHASTAPHGVNFEINVTASRTSFNIQDIEKTWFFEIAPQSNFLSGDIIKLSSEYNNKYIQRVRGSDVLNLAHNIVPGSIWPMMFPGENHFAITPFSSSFNWRSVSYRTAYWGI